MDFALNYNSVFFKSVRFLQISRLLIITEEIKRRQKDWILYTYFMHMHVIGMHFLVNCH